MHETFLLQPSAFAISAQSNEMGTVAVQLPCADYARAALRFAITELFARYDRAFLISASTPTSFLNHSPFLPLALKIPTSDLSKSGFPTQNSLQIRFTLLLGFVANDEQTAPSSDVTLHENWWIGKPVFLRIL